MTNFYSNLVDNPAAVGRRDMHDAKIDGAPVRHAFPVYTPNNPAAGDVVYMAKLPSNARLLPTSKAWYGALTGGTQVQVGFVNDPDALLVNQNMATAGSAALLSTLANANKMVWQLAGLSEDPGTELDVIMTLTTDVSTTDVPIGLELYWTR